MALAEADTCSGSSLLADEPMIGTAPLAAAWIAIEQVGPFGHNAIQQSHFPQDIATELLARIDGLGIRPALIRRVGKHADSHQPMSSRRVFLASSRPGSSAMVTATITDAAHLLEIDFAALAAGDVANAWARAVVAPEPLLLVCTHAKRDVCCALKGRPVAAALVANPRYADLVWEASHLGGHRFAATAVQLPHGWVHGRLDVASAGAVIDGALAAVPTAPMATARGRSSLNGREQAADIEARVVSGIAGIDATRVTDVGDGAFVVSDSSGEQQRVLITEIDLEAERHDSCGKPLTGGRVLHATVV